LKKYGIATHAEHVAQTSSKAGVATREASLSQMSLGSCLSGRTAAQRFALRGTAAGVLTCATTATALRHCC
jgi:hypothetical protein